MPNHEDALAGSPEIAFDPPCQDRCVLHTSRHVQLDKHASIDAMIRALNMTITPFARMHYQAETSAHQLVNLQPQSVLYCRKLPTHQQDICTCLLVSTVSQGMCPNSQEAPADDATA
eukprot:364899-Chlamydomonas_euryale.AAC.36